MKRTTLIKLHLLIAAFVFPAAAMFAVTGSLYTWGIKGSYSSESYPLNLEKPLVKDKNAMLAIVLAELDSRGLPHPTGKAKIKSGGTSYYLEWTGSNMDVSLSPTEEPRTAELTVKTTGLHRLFVQLHKAKGGTAFKVYAAVFGASLLALLLSGFIMALQMPKYRSTTIATAAIGAAAFALMVFIS